MTLCEILACQTFSGPRPLSSPDLHQAPGFGQDVAGMKNTPWMRWSLPHTSPRAGSSAAAALLPTCTLTKSSEAVCLLMHPCWNCRISSWSALQTLVDTTDCRATSCEAWPCQDWWRKGQTSNRFLTASSAASRWGHYSLHQPSALRQASAWLSSRLPDVPAAHASSRADHRSLEMWEH